jgi:hypothetical protein
MQLMSLGSGVGFLKAGFLGFAGSGKTYTAAQLAIGLRKRLGLTGPIAMFDTEAAAQYIAPLVRKETGLDLIGCQSRSFDEAVQFFHAAVEAKASVIIFDSVTHIWMDLSKSYLAQRNESRARQGKNPTSRLEFQDWAVIKTKWAQFSDLYLNSPQHVIINGRAGYEWDFENREDGTGKDLVKTGIKMKAEGEFGFEPSLLVQMERIPVEDPSAKLKSALYVRRATVIKDRFGVIDGMACDNPTFEFFKPYVECLVPGAHVSVDTTPKTDMGVDEEGRVKEWREKKDREIAVEELAGALLAVWPGASAQEKLARQEVVWKLLETRAWEKVQLTNTDKLKAALVALPSAVEEVKKELAEREAREVAAEAEAKAAKKAPKKADTVSA